MTKTTYHFRNIPGVTLTDKEYNGLPFGRQIEHAKKFEEFKATAKTVWISQKRRTTASAIKEFKDLYKPTAFFYRLVTGVDYRNDSIEVWYTNGE